MAGPVGLRRGLVVSLPVRQDPGPAPRPVIANWSLSLRCNFRCDHCYSRVEAARSAEPDTASALAAVDRFAEVGILSLNLGGGEPFLRQDLFEITARAAGRGMRVTLSSNGSLVTPELAHQAARSGIRKVELSLDSVRPEVHDRFRHFPGAFERALQAARWLREAGVTVDVSSVICRINLEDWEGLVDLAASLGARKISLQNYKCSGLGDLNRDRLDLSPAEWRAFYERALELRALRRDVEITLSDPILHSLQRSGCGELARGCACGTLTMAVRPDGSILPCAFMPVVVGNLLEDDFEALWQQAPFLLELRNREAVGKCRSCPSFDACQGGCPARVYSATGGFSAPDPHCWVGQRD